MTIASPTRPTSSVAATSKPARKFSKARRSGTASTSVKPKPTFALPQKPQPAKHNAPPPQAPNHALPPPPQTVKHAVPPKPQPVKHAVPAPPSQAVKQAVPASPAKLAAPPPQPKPPTTIVSSSKTTLEISKTPIIEKAIPPAKRKAHVIALPGQAQSIPQPKTKLPTKRRSSFASTKTKVRNSVLVTTKTPIAEAAAAAAAGNTLPFFAEETLPVPHPDSFVKPKNHQSRLLVHSFGKRGDPSLNMPKLQLSFDKGPFTERERRAIKAAVISFLAEHNIDTKHAYEFVDSKRRRAEFGDQFKKFYPSIIATSGVNRTCEQVYRYLRDVLLNENHERAGESWTPEEDAQLTELFQIHGGRWRKISSAMGRVGCRERYRYLEEFMQPHIRKGEWYPEEETRLIHLVLKHHHPKRLPSGTLQDPSSEAWVSIALEFHTRTIAQIKEKFFYTDLRARWILAWNAMHPEKEGSIGGNGESDSGEEQEEDVEEGSGDEDKSESEEDSKTDDEDTDEDTDEEGAGKKSSQSTSSRKQKKAATLKSKPINLEEFDKKFDESSVNFKWSRDLDLQLLQG
ncbi:RNA polymerase I enhancer binding protein, partial [Chytriomyces hyalinus]